MKYREDDKSKPIPILLDKELRARIARASEKIGEPKSTVMRMAMRLGLDNLERIFSEERPPNSSSSSYPLHQPQGSQLNEPEEKKKKAG